MLKYPITYTDYNNVVRTDDFYFNLNKAEVMEMELGTTGGYTEMIRKIISAQDTPTLVTVFKEFILKAYGEKSPDGKRLMKSKEIAEALYRRRLTPNCSCPWRPMRTRPQPLSIRCFRSRWTVPLHSLRRRIDNEGNGG